MSEPQRLEVESPRGTYIIYDPAGAEGASLADLLRKAGIPLNTRCGQRGLCDGCVIELLSGRLVQNETGEAVGANGNPVPFRACRHRLAGPAARIRVPPRALLAYQPQVVTEFKLNVSRAHDPLWQQLEVGAAPVFAEPDAGAALCRLAGGPRGAVLSDAAAEALPGLRGAPKLWATLERRGPQWHITSVAGGPLHRPLGAAIDVGTTTVALLLVDLIDGKVVGHAADFNQQLQFGDDVVTRITLCANDPTWVGRLQDALCRGTIATLLDRALAQISAHRRQVVCCAVAGNSTMLHLMAGVDPSPMGVVPFTPAFLDHCTLEARALPCPAHMLPGASAYIGADLTAGILASGLLYEDGPSILVDVGTNGEIILKHGRRILACATAAGPAFEGAGLSAGIRAGDGAISHIRMAAGGLRLQADVIGPPGTKPVGLCGSAYIDFLAEARRAGVLTAAGRFDRHALAASGHLVHPGPGVTAFRVAEGQGKRDIFISEADIAKLLPAKAAIAAGILTLLHRAGLKAPEIKTLYLAGGFGTHTDPRQAIACGLLPGFEPGQVRAVGNTALAGAYVALLDSGAIDEMGQVGKKIQVLELNLDPEFEGRYIDELMLPEPG